MALTSGLSGQPSTALSGSPYWSNYLKKRKASTADASGAPVANGALSSLLPNMAQGVSDNIGGMLSGKAYDPYRATAQESMARAAQNLRVAGAQASAGSIGQGAAVAAKQATEQNVYRGLADMNMGLAEQEQAMKERGVSAAIDLAGKNMAAQAMDDSVAQTALAQQDKSSSDLASYFTVAAPNSTDANGNPTYDWRQDAEATRRIAAAGYDVNSDGAAIDQLYKTASMSTEDRSINALKNSTWYKGLDDTQRAAADANVIPYLSKLSTFGGDVEPVFDEATGQFSIIDKVTGEYIGGALEGKKVYSDPTDKALSSGGASDDTILYLNSADGMALRDQLPADVRSGDATAVAAFESALPELKTLSAATTDEAKAKAFGRMGDDAKKYAVLTGAFTPSTIVDEAGHPTLLPWGEDLWNLARTPGSDLMVSKSAALGSSGEAGAGLFNGKRYTQWTSYPQVGKVFGENGEYYVVTGMSGGNRDQSPWVGYTNILTGEKSWRYV